MSKFVLFMSLVFCTQIAKSQEKGSSNQIPVPVELNLGNNRYGLQIVMNKTFSPLSRFSFLTVTSFMSEYKNNSTDNLDFISNTQVGYNFFKGISVVAALTANSQKGLAPSAGLQYLFANKKILLVLSPTLELSDTKNIQGLTVFEYKPSLTNKLTLYSRFQAMYNYDTKNEQHQRSYVQLRLGLGINKYQFGLATTLDYYGPPKILKDNYGVFFRVNFL